MHGIKRILLFCTLTTILPIILLITPLYLRHNYYASVAYAVTDSDILEVTDGISPVFCSAHTLQMNRTFNAFQMRQKPETTSYRKHIRLKKSMTLPDDTLEYWGFYLLRGATVALSVCSRFQGASILVVKGERNLRTCGMLEHHNTQIIEGIFLPEARKQVKVTFQTNMEEVNYNGSTVHNNILKTMDDTLPRNFTAKNTDDDTLSVYAPVRGNLMAKKESHNERWKKLIENENIQQYLTSEQKGIVYDKRKLRHVKTKQNKMKNKEKRNIEVLMNKENLHSNQSNVILKKLQRKLRSEPNTNKDIPAMVSVQKELWKERIKRNQEPVKPTLLLDQGVKHGGNAVKNTTVIDDESSISSFENELFTCYGGSILISQEFAPSEKCIDVTYLINGKHMQAVHNVVEDGYYYYIFYSDNDIVSNDLYALFDIYKPVFHYENITKSCINKTTCSFSMNILSPDRVIVEIPTKDNVENEIEDVNLLLSVCHPRREVYIIFPIAVLVFILTCAFM